METNTNTHRDSEVAPELAELNLADKPDGPGAAAILAAGIGIFTTGLFTILSEVSEWVHEFLVMDAGVGVGPLSGKTIMGTIGFFGSWAVLGYLWKDKDVDIKRVFWIGLAFGVVGAIFMLPPVFLAFA